jgi:hypothetical protein
MKTVVLICLLFATVLLSCDDVFEDDLGKVSMNVLAPANNAINPNYVQTFWWDYVEEATHYQLQLVQPSFDSVLVLLFDTTVSTNKFQYTLSPGSYEWRIRALNGSSNTNYVSRKFQVVKSSISGQNMVTISPQNLLESNTNNFSFSWQTLFGASQYRLQIDTLNFVNEANLVYNNSTNLSSINYSFVNDGNYQWRVRAENDNLFSNWSTTNTLTIDRVAPTRVSLLSPLNNETVALPINFTWISISDAVTYKLYVYKSDSTSLYNSSFPVIIGTNNASINIPTAIGKLFWQVSAIDKAGNEGEKSVKRNITIQ